MSYLAVKKLFRSAHLLRCFGFRLSSTTSESRSLGSLLQSHHLTIVGEEKLMLSKLYRCLELMESNVENLDLIQDTITRIDEVFMVVIVGEFNAGKSTFINSLLGAKYLKDGVLPTTDKICILRYSKDVNNRDSSNYIWRKEKNVLLDDIEDVKLPVPWLKHIALVDTPGTNAIISRHEQLTQRIVPRADLVLFVTSAERPLSESECTFLSKIKQWGKKVIIVIIFIIDYYYYYYNNIYYILCYFIY